jgi:hypothetical protein
MFLQTELYTAVPEKWDRLEMSAECGSSNPAMIRRAEPISAQCGNSSRAYTIKFTIPPETKAMVISGS